MVLQSHSPDVTTVDVPLGDRGYAIRIGSGDALAASESIASAVGDLSHLLLVVDDAVREAWAEPLAGRLAAGGVRVDRYFVPSGEPSKSVDQLSRLWRWMLACGADRRSVVAAVGGGVVGDLAGFAAATFARGIRFVQVPTTLLAMVDSSVGGKTGINLPEAKNIVGAFWQPSLVLINTDTLSTLPDRTFFSGLAEVVKYGVIEDAGFFEWLERNAERLVDRDADALRLAIRRSCESKARVVLDDERETSGRRAILNYGHTFAHAIEATAGYGSLLHGEAVSIGMQMAARLAIRTGLCDDELLSRQTRLLERCRLPVTIAVADPETMLPAMARDKKVAHGKLRFVLPTRIGRVKLVDAVDASDVTAAITQTR